MLISYYHPGLKRATMVEPRRSKGYCSPKPIELGLTSLLVFCIVISHQNALTTDP